MKQPYGYIYFIFAGYRVAIGKTTNLYQRRITYQRSRLEIQILGLIPCQSKEELEGKEKQILKRFEADKVFRDMFYFSKEMKDWIVKNTIPLTKSIEDSLARRNRRERAELWRRSPEYRQKQRERKQRDKKNRALKTNTL